MVPRKASEVGACKDLEGHIFTISSGNKGKDGEMLRTSVEKMATYIGTKFGNDAAQEWTSGAQTVLPDPTYSPFILARHAERVKATMDRLNLKLTSLRDERVDIVDKMTADPTNRRLKKELREIDDDIAKTEIELKDEVKMKLTDNEKTAHGNAWRTRRELTNLLKTSRGKVYSLLLGQCTQVLVDKMKQDNNWVAISTLFNPSLLLKLIEKFVLKQSNK
jgi:F0F1-type ATP synthase assembly protein I